MRAGRLLTAALCAMVLVGTGWARAGEALPPEVADLVKRMTDPKEARNLVDIRAKLVRVGQPVVPGLIEVLKTAKDTPVRLNALIGLVEIAQNKGNASAALPLVRELLTSTDAPLRHWAIKATGVLKDTESVPVLVKMLDGELKSLGDKMEVLKVKKSPAALTTAKDLVASLGMIGDKQSEPILISLLKDYAKYLPIDDSVGLSAAAAESLGTLKDTAALTPLVEVLKSCTAASAATQDPRVISAAADAIVALSGCDLIPNPGEKLPDLEKKLADWQKCWDAKQAKK